MSNSVLMMLPDRISSGGKDHIFTPQEVASDMVDTVPEKVFVHDSTFCDTCCKSGVFLETIYNKLMDSPDLIREKPNRYKRHKHILENQLFGISPTKECQALSIRTVYGDINVKNNIICLGDKYLDIMKNKDRRFLYEILKKEFGRMKFNVVALNPPYNKGMDLDFVNMAFDLSTDYVIAITPAKWQTAEANQRISSNMSYGEFRKKIVPHMSQVVFYPDCYDIFAISESDGITYYILDKYKDTAKPCKVINKCKHKDIINSIEYRDICNRQTLFNIGNKIIESMGTYNKLQIKAISSHKYQVNINKQMTVGGGGFSTRELGADGKWHVRKDIVGNGSMLFSITDGTLTVIGNPKIIDNTTEHSQSSINIFSSNSLDECEYFYSFIGCKLIRFLVLMNISSLACVGNTKTWRFVPAPTSGKFDHIYTDEELYKTFNLPQEYIDVIEAVIKERK